MRIRNKKSVKQRLLKAAVCVMVSVFTLTTISWGAPSAQKNINSCLAAGVSRSSGAIFGSLAGAGKGTDEPFARWLRSWGSHYFRRITEIQEIDNKPRKRRETRRLALEISSDYTEISSRQISPAKKRILKVLCLRFLTKLLKLSHYENSDTAKRKIRGVTTALESGRISLRAAASLGEDAEEGVLCEKIGETEIEILESAHSAHDKIFWGLPIIDDIERLDEFVRKFKKSNPGKRISARVYPASYGEYSDWLEARLSPVASGPEIAVELRKSNFGSRNLAPYSESGEVGFKLTLGGKNILSIVGRQYERLTLIFSRDYKKSRQRQTVMLKKPSEKLVEAVISHVQNGDLVAVNVEMRMAARLDAENVEKYLLSREASEVLISEEEIEELRKREEAKRAEEARKERKEKEAVLAEERARKLALRDRKKTEEREARRYERHRIQEALEKEKENEGTASREVLPDTARISRFLLGAGVLSVAVILGILFILYFEEAAKIAARKDKTQNLSDNVPRFQDPPQPRAGNEQSRQNISSVRGSQEAQISRLQWSTLKRMENDVILILDRTFGKEMGSEYFEALTVCLNPEIEIGRRKAAARKLLGGLLRLPRSSRECFRDEMSDYSTS